jgi:hypothetical protein
VLGLGEEAVLLVPVCGPAFGRRVRLTAVEATRRGVSNVRETVATTE